MVKFDFLVFLVLKKTTKQKFFYFIDNFFIAQLLIPTVLEFVTCNFLIIYKSYLLSVNIGEPSCAQTLPYLVIFYALIIMITSQYNSLSAIENRNYSAKKNKQINFLISSQNYL